MIIYIAAVLLMLIGLYGVAAKHNLIKVAIGLMIMQYSVDLFLIALAAHRLSGREWFSQLAAVLGLSTTVVLVAVIKRNYDRSGAIDITRLTKLKG
ncbi:MAG: NADH-quinone oxidoreductase subunit K [Candidatus Margulisbacteria bacterium]|nr:NADH-quinone oxidoreductase subunit K [Candidatus Margulisiibacteriota bacterium]